MDKELKQYINSTIKAKYKTFDRGHSIAHFNFVTKNCIGYGKQLISQGYDIDLDIAYIVGAYHDIGMIHGRKNHPLESGKFVRQDKTLAKYYPPETIETIAQAVEDHSSSLSSEPRSIYGKLVSDADRNNTLYLVFSRPIKFAIDCKPKNFSKQEYIQEVYDFINKKSGRNGYVKYWLDIPDTKKAQQQVWELLDDKEKCYQYISGIFDEITKGKYAD